MGSKTEISWCDSTWSPVRGCSRVSPGCVNCYAERMCARGLPGLKSPTTGEDFAIMKPSGPHWTGKVELIEDQLDVPLHWKKPRWIFVDSMSDTFHENLSDEARDRIFAMMALCPQHQFLVLTKRSREMREYMKEAAARVSVLTVSRDAQKIPGWADRISPSYAAYDKWWPLPNVHLGVSVEDRAHKSRIDDLRETPAALRFLSLEPLLEELGTLDLRGIGWTITGCESGPGRRPDEHERHRTVLRQCHRVGVKVFVKQVEIKGRVSHDPREWPLDLRVRDFPRGAGGGGKG